MRQIQVFYPPSLAAWKEWLEKNHNAKQAVWLVFYSKKSSKPSVTWGEAVDVALVPFLRRPLLLFKCGQ
jgi:uncharacterized protein YdeI (YjbR/CyaY-like superfamily)